ncbi:MAG: tetratricopeptide repeat protein, partial [Planctomycetota bacterium]
LAACNGPSGSTSRARGIGAYDRGDYPGALQHFTAARDKLPGEARSHYDLGRTQLALGNATEARNAFGVALRLDPENETYLRGQVDAMIADDRGAQAIEMLTERAERLDTPEAWLLTGDTQRRLGFPEAARDSFARADAVGLGRSIEAHRALAQLRREVGDRDGELRRLSYILYLDPTDPMANARVRELGEIPGPAFRQAPPRPGS